MSTRCTEKSFSQWGQLKTMSSISFILSFAFSYIIIFKYLGKLSPLKFLTTLGVLGLCTVFFALWTAAWAWWIRSEIIMHQIINIVNFNFIWFSIISNLFKIYYSIWTLNEIVYRYFTITTLLAPQHKILKLCDFPVNQGILTGFIIVKTKKLN